MEIYLTKNLSGHLVPSMANDKDLLKSIKVGDSVKCKITRPRNLGHHRKYFAFLDIVMNNMPESLESNFKSIEDLLTELKMQLGYHELKVSLGGVSYYTPKSISFSKMNQTEFEKFYNDSIDIVCKHIISGIDKQSLIDELVSF